jgi:FKBP-type peptidyl-prolyl cis-trans isomerase FkpA
MKTKIVMIISVILSIFMASCGQDYKKTKSGLVYKIIPGGSKDSAAGGKDKMKFHVMLKQNDSVLFTSFDKMPIYQEWANNDPRADYTLYEVLFKMKKGDSAIVIQDYDSLVKRGMNKQFPTIKKGDRVKINLKVLEIFRDDSSYQKDFAAEEVKDAPRRAKEEKEMMAKQQEEMKKQEAEMQKRKEEYFKNEAKQIEEMRKSGVIAKQEKEITDYLAKKKITNATKSEGTFVVVKEKGTGAPAAKGKYVTVKYSGRRLETDSVFQSSHYTFPLGERQVIWGWDQGLMLFNKGGKGTLYIPTYLAYGDNAAAQERPAGPLIFDVEILEVADTPQQGEVNQKRYDSLAAAKNIVKRAN